MKVYRPYDQEQMMLMPVALQDAFPVRIEVAKAEQGSTIAVS